MDKRKYLILYFLISILIILFVLGYIYLIHIIYGLLKNKQDLLRSGIFYIFYLGLGLFYCFNNMKLLIKIRKVLNSKETLDEKFEAKLKIECKSAIFFLIAYIISIPWTIAVFR